MTLIERAVKFSFGLDIKTVIVSTDSSRYMDIATNAGALDIPRPSLLAADNTSTYDVVLHEWKSLEESHN